MFAARAVFVGVGGGAAVRRLSARAAPRVAVWVRGRAAAAAAAALLAAAAGGAAALADGGDGAPDGGDSVWDAPRRLWARATEAVGEFTRKFQEPSREQLLPPPLPREFAPRMTLVLDLEDTLLVSEWDRDRGRRYKKRPSVDYFLEYLSQYYEIVVFSKANAFVSGPLLDKLDTKGFISYRLFRDATLYKDGVAVKDLSRLGRPLDKVVIIDDEKEAFGLQPENGIVIAAYKGDDSDKALADLIPFLEYVALEVDDARTAIEQFAHDERFPASFNEWLSKHVRKGKLVESELARSGVLGMPAGGGGATFVPGGDLSALGQAGGMGPQFTPGGAGGLPGGFGALGRGATSAARPRRERTVWNWLFDRVEPSRIEALEHEAELKQELRQRYGSDATDPTYYSAAAAMFKQLEEEALKQLEEMERSGAPLQ